MDLSEYRIDADAEDGNWWAYVEHRVCRKNIWSGEKGEALNVADMLRLIVEHECGEL